VAQTLFISKCLGRGLLPPPRELISHRPLRFLDKASDDQTSFAGSDVTIVIPVGAHLDFVGEAKFASDFVFDFV
jgi:hypothetical protein